MILSILSLAVIATYVGIMIKREGIPYSISATYYILEHRWAFGLSMLLTAALLYTPLHTDSKAANILSAFACLGMAITAIAPNFRNKGDKVIHVIGAGMALICSQIYVGMVCPLLLFAWPVYACCTILVMDEDNYDMIDEFLSTKPMFWVEVVSLLTIYLSVWVK